MKTLKIAEKALSDALAFLLTNLNVPWTTDVQGVDLPEKAALAYAAAFDAEMEKGLSFAEHDKWYALARISGRGVGHAFSDEETIRAIDEYLANVREWMELE